jgi:hypothetical protein
MNFKKLLGYSTGFLVLMASIAIPATVPAIASGNASNGNIWKVYDYNPSNRAFRQRVPTNLNAGGVEFSFLSTPDTAYLLTGNKHSGLLGDLTGGILTAEVGITPAGTCVQYYGGPSGCSSATVRLYFETDTSGKGFDPKDYWWFTGSGSGEAALSLMTTATLTGDLADPSQWSDWDGHNALYDQAHTDAFNAAVANVQYVGLSYGGGSGYANGVGATGGPASFQLNSYTVVFP